ncbi:hypothetical protein OS493_020423 [Desmophyllum pertusum]|uniref:Uncharacterized protein n=1 Tax=Desmophyllum pertusum TaxID=174260 RepID=A0A9X0CX65_9CNID|nr:hypothetical protein OS493_020423 [Desmophyllum pertusum]
MAAEDSGVISGHPTSHHLTEGKMNRQVRNFLHSWNLLPENISQIMKGKLCCDFPRPDVNAVYTPELDEYIAALVQGAKALDKGHHFLQDKVPDITGPLYFVFEHLTSMKDSASKEEGVTLTKDEIQNMLTARHLPPLSRQPISQKRCQLRFLQPQNRVVPIPGPDLLPERQGSADHTANSLSHTCAKEEEEMLAIDKIIKLQVPINKVLALHRLHKLKSRMENDAKYRQDYTAFMQDIIDKRLRRNGNT